MLLFLLYLHSTPHGSRIKAERRSRLKAMEERAKKGVSPLQCLIVTLRMNLTHSLTVVE